MRKNIDIPDEIVKDLIGYEDLYRISNKGRIFRAPIKKKLVNGEYLDLPAMELSIKGKIGYPTVMLSKKGIQKSFMVHRLVAIHFIENDNPLVKREVNHKDKNIFNFSAKNLEWCTRSENNKHAKRKNYSISLGVAAVKKILKK